MVLKAISGELSPEPRVLLLSAPFQLPSFCATVTGRSVELVPRQGVEMDGVAGAGVARREIEALLLVLGSEGGEPLRFKVLQVAEAGANGQVGIIDYAFATDSNEATLSPGPESLMRLARQVEWAGQDALYRELLDLLLWARRATNPRPLVYNMVERLEKRYGSRREACGVLGLSQTSLAPAVNDQGAYDGDRHADHPVGATRPEIPESVRQAALDVASRLLRAYEGSNWPSP